MTLKETFVEAYRSMGFDFMTACEKATDTIDWIKADPRNLVPVGIGNKVYTVKKRTEGSKPCD